MNAILTHKEESSDKVRDFLSILRKDVVHSQDMREMGINTTLAQKIETFVLNPFGALVEAYHGIFQDLKNTINELCLEYFRLKSPLIEKVFNVSGSNDLTYYVVLKNDNTKNRMTFFDFISHYETLGFSDKMPITVKFLPKRVLEKSNLKDEIALS